MNKNNPRAMNALLLYAMMGLDNPLFGETNSTPTKRLCHVCKKECYSKLCGSDECRKKYYKN